jgi:hypothetical protein
VLSEGVPYEEGTQMKGQAVLLTWLIGHDSYITHTMNVQA